MADSDIDDPSLFHVRKEKSNGRTIVELTTEDDRLLVDQTAINAVLTDGLRSVFGRVHDGDPLSRPLFLGSITVRPQITIDDATDVQ